MRGRRRIREKLLRGAGWDVARDGRAPDGVYHLTLRRDGEERDFTAASRSRAWRQAERALER